MEDELSMSQIGLKKHYEEDKAKRSPVERIVMQIDSLIKKWDDKRIDLLHWRRTGPIPGGWEQSKIVEDILIDLKKFKDEISA